MPVFTIGAVFSRFFKLLSENAVLFIGLALVCNVLPTAAMVYGLMSYVHVTDWNQRFVGMTGDTFFYIFGGTVLLYLVNLAIISIVTEVAIVRAVGKKVALGSVISHAFGNIFPLFAVSLSVSLIVGGGLILLVVPGIIWALCTCVAVPAYIGQPGLGIGGAVTRSFALTRNHRWQLFLIFLLGLVILMVIGAGLGALRLAFAGFDNANLVYQMISSSLDSALNLPAYVFSAAIYVTLRESKDKQAPEQTAAVFG